MNSLNRFVGNLGDDYVGKSMCYAKIRTWVPILSTQIKTCRHTCMHLQPQHRWVKTSGFQELSAHYSLNSKLSFQWETFSQGTKEQNHIERHLIPTSDFYIWAYVTYICIQQHTYTYTPNKKQKERDSLCIHLKLSKWGN